MKKEISIVMPAFNEEANIEKTVRDCFLALERLGVSGEVVVTDDGSIDKTRSIIEGLKNEYPDLSVVIHEKNSGYGESLKDAIFAARGKYIVSIDSDGQFDISEIPVLIKEQNKGYDVVAGYRKKKKDAAFKVSADGNDIEIIGGDLLYDYNLSFDGTTVKLEKRENPEYKYELSADGKTLTLNRTKGGVPEILTYTIENPDDLKLELRYDGGDADVVISTTDDSKSAYFEILPDGSFVSQDSDVARSDVLANDYDITLDGTTIKILKKPQTAPV